MDEENKQSRCCPNLADVLKANDECGECPAGLCSTIYFAPVGKMSDELKRLLFPHVRLPRKEKKRCMNRVLRDKKTLIHILVCSMIDRSTTFNEIAAAMFRDKPRIEQEYKIFLSLNKVEWRTANTLLKRIYKRRRKLLKRLWQRDRNLSPGV